MKHIVLFALFLPTLIHAQDTLHMDQERVDNLLKTDHQFTGIALVEPIKALSDLANMVGRSSYLYFNFDKGQFLFKDEVIYFENEDGPDFGHPRYSKLHSHDIKGKFYEKSYYGRDSLQYLSKTELKNDTLVSYVVNYNKAGKLFSHGHYHNDLEQGNWPTYRYNDSILFTEIWTLGYLTSVKPKRTIFVGAKNQIISQEEYFEIIKSQDGIEWNVFAVPTEKLDNSEHVAFIMYSEQLDFSQFMDKKWEDFKFVDVLLKRNKKYLKKSRKGGE